MKGQNSFDIFWGQFFDPLPQLTTPIEALEGKTTHKAPTRVKEDYVEIPHKLKAKHSNLVLCIDIMFVDGMQMFTGIDCCLKKVFLALQ